MPPNPFLGVLLHAIGGLAAGSFYTPLRKVRRWSWESYWLFMGLVAWIVTPCLVAWLTTPRLVSVLAESPKSSLGWAYFFGAVWGVGSATFGLTMRYLGIALGMAVALGFCAIFGFLIPPLFKGELAGFAASGSGQIILGGVVVCMAGIAVCGWAGVRKEREVSEEEKKESVEEFALVKGLIVAVIAGVMSAGFAYGIQAGQPIAKVALEAGVNPLFQNNASLLVITSGGFTVNLVWCLVLARKNRSLGDYVKGPPRIQLANYLLCALGGSIWYFQFFFYGMGTTRMGEYDFSSWTLHMAFIIVFSNLWGMALREWKGCSRRTLWMVGGGIAVLVASTMIIGEGNRRQAGEASSFLPLPPDRDGTQEARVALLPGGGPGAPAHPAGLGVLAHGVAEQVSDADEDAVLAGDHGPADLVLEGGPQARAHGLAVDPHLGHVADLAQVQDQAPAGGG